MPNELRVNVIVALVRAVHAEVEQLGKTQFQKLVYFLQESGIWLDYKYEIYHYGPYCFELSSDLSSLDSLNVLEVSTDPGGYGFDIKLAEHAPDCCLDEEYAKKLEYIVGALGADKPANLEVKSTAHFVHKVLSKNGQRAGKDIVIAKVRDLKPHFNEAFVEKCYDELVAVKLL